MSSWSLLESASWNQSDTCVLQNFQTVKQVRGLSLSGFLDFFGEFNLWECVHGSFNLITCDVFHSSEEVCNKTGSFLEWVKQGLVLSLEADSCGFLNILKWWITHQIDHKLSDRVWTQVYTLDLDELGSNIGVEVMYIHVTTSETAFTQQTLWDGMKRNKLAIVLVLRSHGVENSVGGYEDGALLVDVFPVNLGYVQKLLHQRWGRVCSWLRTRWFSG